MGDSAASTEVVEREEAATFESVSKHTVMSVETSHMETSHESTVHVESMVQQASAVSHQEVSQTQSITAVTSSEETNAIEEPPPSPPAIEPQPVDENANAIPDEPAVEEPAPVSEPEPTAEPIPEPPVEAVEESVPEPAPEPAEEPAPAPVEEPVSEPVEEPAAEPIPEVAPEPVPSPVTETKEEVAVAEEISQENIKIQLHEIINEIEQEVLPEEEEVKEVVVAPVEEIKSVEEEAKPVEVPQPVAEPQPVAFPQPVAEPQPVVGQMLPVYEGEMEEYEYYDEDGTLHHTWRPKGKYNVRKTEILYEDVVPIQVPEVALTVPAIKPQSVRPIQPQEIPQQMVADQIPNNLEGLTNGGLAPGEEYLPLEIPEGIPLLARILPKTDQGLEGDKKISLERLFTPATDSGDLTPIKKKAFASSAFYRPDHPTIDDQVELAQRISFSLVDENNKMSRGQSMYMKRKNRSMRWVHQGPGSGFEVMDDEPSRAPEKPAMKLLMSSRGVQDFQQVQEHYQNLMNQAPPSPEVGKLVTEISSPTGKGAELFAKRKKRMDKFIVDETTVQKSMQSSMTQQSFSSSSSSSFNSTSVSSQNVSSKTISSKKQAELERDKQQDIILDEFLKHRESSILLVKSPWTAALETGNVDDAFVDKRSKFQLAEAVCERAETKASSVPRWLEMPKPVPVATGVSLGAADAGAGAIYTAEVKVVQRASLPPTPIDIPHHSLLELVTVESNSDKRRSASFNLAAKGWGTYNNFYTPVTFATKS